MKTEISALIDGELDAGEVRAICISMRQDEALRRTCSAYVLIGDALRQEPYLSTDIAGKVLDHLADGPVVLSPRGWAGAWQQGREWHKPLLAMAATLAGVAVVAWVEMAKQPAPELAQAQLNRPQPVVMASATADADMQEYLIAHQIQSGTMYLNGEAQHIRTVSMNGAESAR